MKQTLLFAIAIFWSALISAQSLTPTVIATAGFGYTSPELQVDMTVGETFIITLQTPEVILTQGFHQPVALQGGGCINLALIDPDAACPLVFDPVCGCDGVTYANSCVAQTTAGVTTWTPGECGAAIPGCLSMEACNFNPIATEDDGSCLFIGFPCDDGNMMTIDDVITFDCFCQGQLVSVLGCIDGNACNYNSAATVDDGSCFFVGDACDDGDANTSNDVYNANCECEGVVSVEELQVAISLYPNPASSELIVTINGLAPTEVQIFDATGRVVRNAQRTSRIDIQTLASGVYTFRVMHEGSVWEEKVVVERN